MPPQRRAHALSEAGRAGPGETNDGGNMAENEREGDESPSTPKRRAGRGKLIILAAVVAALAAVGGVALLVNIMERKQEARNPFYRVVELTDETEDPVVWGKN